ncbi:MAG: 8-amino-7-oxononanoate synthase [Candidatus Poribacteria bacterium]|nr:8-amino-7-oxononanoate synthase [Candidatus Poribacteria bacterium]MDE0506580.1 8-amino-7-oxononanoate synthase [Candidatus Poribacteria bacterium]
MKIDCWLETERVELERAGHWRSLRSMMGAPTGRVLLDGRDVISLASTDYLGLSRHPQVIKAASEAVREYGVGASGSRLIAGNNHLYDVLETKIAAMLNTEAALVFSSGYLANISTIPVLAGEDDLILSDERNHISLIEGCRLSRATTQIYRHCDPEHLKELLAESSNFRRRLIVTDGVFSMDGDFPPLAEICDIAETYDAMLMVDDVHGFGILGQTGGGLVDYLGVADRGIIQIGALSKAVGGVGAFVAGSKSLIDILINRARGFIFTTALPPGTLAAASAAIDIIRSSPEFRYRLFANVHSLRTGLSGAGFQLLPNETHILPLIIGEANMTTRFSEALLNEGIFVPAIRPPTVPAGTSRLRITPTANHTHEELEEALNGFAAARTAAPPLR